jgi:hypothetical protein
MKETEMGNRGSKSGMVIPVKEQRVDGSWCKKPLHLRGTLMGFERNYQIKYPSKQFKINFSILHSDLNVQLNPWFITGLSDSEGTFTIIIDKVIKRKMGWRVQAKYQMGLHIKDLALLLKVLQFFGGIGSVTKSNKMAFYSVSKI